MTKKAARKAAKAGKKAAKKAAKRGAADPALLPALSAEGAGAAGLAAASAAPSLLEKARARWEHGAWADLLELDGPALATDPERGKLALLLAAAHSQVGDMAEARRLARQAMVWGCSRAIVARVLLSSAENSLARTAAAVGEDPSARFAAAIRLVQPQTDAMLVGRTRQIRELGRMGLLPGAPEGDPGGPPPLPPAAPARIDPAATARTCAIYRNLPAGRLRNFRYLDVKSLPRTGLHFMRNSFDSILREGFSFCEWYTEPGCCRQMPCALTAHATEAQDRALVRMVKSHDFDLADPAFPTGGPIRRLILIRDPLFLLTSWWSLRTLWGHEALLERHGIRKSKLNHRHDPQVLRAAYRIVDAEGAMPPPAALSAWLDRQTAYVTGFAAKWHAAAAEDGPGTRILRYRETPAAVIGLLEEIADRLDDAARDRLAAFRAGRDTVFAERTDPFDAPGRRIADYLRDNADLFHAAARTIVARDATGLLREA